MNDNVHTISIVKYVRDLREVIAEHSEEAGAAMQRIQTPDVLRPSVHMEQLWITFIAIHTALVDWIVDEGIRDSRIRACAMLDAGWRIHLDEVRDRLVAELDQQKPNVISLRS